VPWRLRTEHLLTLRTLRTPTLNLQVEWDPFGRRDGVFRAARTA
jgi:predicted alpha/beta-hydrolase family hydrolase